MDPELHVTSPGFERYDGALPVCLLHPGQLRLRDVHEGLGGPRNTHPSKI